MPHIPLSDNLPGIVGLFEFRPETAQPLLEQFAVLLGDESTLSPGEREIIAEFVSSLNECEFCANTHSWIAAHHHDGDMEPIEAVKRDFDSAPISSKLKKLRNIASKGRSVTEADVMAARGKTRPI